MDVQKDIHPVYRPVVFEDTSCGFRILTGSTVKTSKTTEWEDGRTYPYVTVDISSASHPVYTGQRGALRDTAGRVERFNAKYGRRSSRPS